MNAHPDVTWEERLGWFDQGGAIVCAHCMTAKEWEAAFAVAAERADKPADASLLVFAARKLIEQPDPQLAGKLVQEMVEVVRTRGRADAILAITALLTIDNGGVAVVRLFDEALRRLADESPNAQGP